MSASSEHNQLQPQQPQPLNNNKPPSTSSSSISNQSLTEIKPIIPSQHLVIIEERPYFVLCKPKLLPLKSIALLQIEQIQNDAEEKIKSMQKAATTAAKTS